MMAGEMDSLQVPTKGAHRARQEANPCGWAKGGGSVP